MNWEWMDGLVQSQAIVDGGYFRDREGGWDESREEGPRERTTRWKSGGVMVRRWVTLVLCPKWRVRPAYRVCSLFPVAYHAQSSIFVVAVK